MILTFLDKYRNQGLLLLRVGLGIMFILHGYPKLMGGPEKWAGLGQVMAMFGIKFAPVFWGFMASFAEFGGGILLLLGLLTRPACFLMFFTMMIAAAMHLMKGDGFGEASHAIEDGIVFLSLILIGPGKYSLDEKLAKKE